MNLIKTFNQLNLNSIDELIKPTPSQDSKEKESTDQSDQSILLNGPLSVIYAKALNLQYAKHDQLTGEMKTATPEPGPLADPVAVVQKTDAAKEPALESQVNDHYAEAVIRENEEEEILESNSEDPIITVTYPYGTSSQGESEQEPTPVRVMQELSQTGIPHEFVFVQGAMAPSDDSPVGGQTYSMVENNRRVSVESIQIVVKLKPQ